MTARPAIPADLRGFDFETWPIRPGLLAPKPVCASFFPAPHDLEVNPDTVRRGDSGVCVGPAMPAALVALLTTPGQIVVGHNLAYDMAVACAEWPEVKPLVFAAYREGRVWDTYVRERLIRNAQGTLGLIKKGELSLAGLAAKYLHEDISSTKGPDAWRLRYHELDGVALEDWPEEAILYSAEDARYPVEVAEFQARSAAGCGMLDAERHPLAVVDEVHQCRTAFALQLASVWGLRTDAEAVEALAEVLRTQIGDVIEWAQREGFVRADKSVDKKALQARVAAAYLAKGSPAPLTEPSTKFPEGQISTSKETLQKSGDPVLEAWGFSSSPRHHLTNTIKHLRQGVERPINVGYNVVMGSGRTSSSDPFNIQNQPRKGGFRECYRPRPGYVYVVADYSQLELCTLGQIWLWLFGESSLATAINAGLDLHLVLVSTLRGLPYDAVSKATHKLERELAKSANYGFPVGMGAAKWLLQLKKKVFEGDLPKELAGVTQGEAERVKRAWLQTWPESKRYFDWVGDQVENHHGRAVDFGSGRIRGGCTFTEFGNSAFQGLAADGATLACQEVQEEAHCDRRSPLWGSRLVVFVHDELVLETPEERGDAAAHRLETIMVESMRRYTPDVTIEAEPLVTRLWSKAAKPTYSRSGGLVPWAPEIAAADSRDAHGRLLAA